MGSIFFLEKHVVYEIMWKNTVEKDRTQVTLWRMRTACWITYATNTFIICNTYCFSTGEKKWLQESDSQ